jgi:hypothetical protein
MRGSNQKYFNFPIALLEGFLKDDANVLNDIYDYATYVKAVSYYEKEGFEWVENEVAEKAVSLSDSFYGIKTGDKTKAYENGMQLFNSIPSKTPMAGINIDVFFDYFENSKTDFEKVCLLAFLSIKSILQNKAYCKITNKYWLSRMDGKACSIKTEDKRNFEGLSKEIKDFSNEYQTKKIKAELENNWGLSSYSRYNRGFYVSFKLDINALVYEAEKRKKSTKEKQTKLSKELALKKALARLNN